MGKVKDHIILIFLAAWCHLAVRGQPATQANDSVFSRAMLASIPLTDVSMNKTVALPAAGDPGSLSLFVFLSPECPLCQNYTTVLNKLEKQYAGKVKFYGIIPGKAYNADVVRSFREKYKIAFPLFLDASFRLSRYLQASVTPETILLNDRNELVYKGAIDNWLKDLGKMQARTTAHYLQDAIDRYPHQNNPKRTKAVGCLINDQ